MKRSLCILLVEDDPALGPMTCHGLVELGHRSVLASTGPSAYQHLSKVHDFEVILLDLQLGDERSEPLILRLREEGITVPAIVVYSADPMIAIERAARAIDAKGYVQKPASLTDIDRAIQAAAA
jgi:CheY-like chemotaxis protein